jgi:hypothetical protein
MSGHTPGPWFASSAYGNHSAIWIGPEQGVQMVLQGANCLRSDSVLHEQIGVDQLVANAFLIAAAPDLLAALLTLRDFAVMSNVRQIAYLDAGNQHPVEVAQAAIAKAMEVQP